MRIKENNFQKLIFIGYQNLYLTILLYLCSLYSSNYGIQLKPFMNRNLITKFENRIESVARKLDINAILKQALQKYSIRSYNITKINANEGLKLYKEAFAKYIFDQTDQNMTFCSQKIIGYLTKGEYTYGFAQSIRKSFKNRSIILQILSYFQSSQDWLNLSELFPGKQPNFLEYQAKNIIFFLRNHKWTTQQDHQLTLLIEKYGLGKWNEIAKDMFFTNCKKILRKPKQCRQRWLNYLDSKKSRGGWSELEDNTIMDFVKKNGRKWSKIVRLLGQQRTQHMVKNRYFSLLRKQQKYRKNSKYELDQIIVPKLEQEDSPDKQQIKQKQNKNTQVEKLIKQQQKDHSSFNGKINQKQMCLDPKIIQFYQWQNKYYHSIVPTNFWYENYFIGNYPPFYPINSSHIHQFDPYINGVYFAPTCDHNVRPHP